MSIATDSKGVDEAKDTEKDNVFALHKLFTEGPEFEELKDRYESGGIGYKESKEILIKNIIKYVSPLRDKRKKFEDNPGLVKEILTEGGKKARIEAEEKMEEIREKVGTKLS